MRRLWHIVLVTLIGTISVFLHTLCSLAEQENERAPPNRQRLMYCGHVWMSGRPLPKLRGGEEANACCTTKERRLLSLSSSNNITPHFRATALYLSQCTTPSQWQGLPPPPNSPPPPPVACTPGGCTPDPEAKQDRVPRQIRTLPRCAAPAARRPATVPGLIKGTRSELEKYFSGERGIDAPQKALGVARERNCARGSARGASLCREPLGRR
eukprot:gene11471-biopygen21405